jgi:hypothetical protein
VGAKLFCAEGQTDVMKLSVAFSNFVNVSKKAEYAYESMVEGKV